MSQTSHPRKMSVARPGQLSDSSELKDAMSAVSAEDDGNDFPQLAFGTMVALDDPADDEGMAVVNLASAGDTPAGIVLLSHAYAQDEELNDLGLTPGTMASILQRGRVWVYLEEAVDAGDPVRYRAVADPDANEVAGAFRTSDPSGTDTVLITAGARYVTGGAQGGVAELEIDMLNLAVTADS